MFFGLGKINWDKRINPEKQDRQWMAPGGGINEARASAKIPEKSILDKNFKYVNAASTNISKTFERIRQQQVQQQAPKKVRRIK